MLSRRSASTAAKTTVSEPNQAPGTLKTNQSETTIVESVAVSREIVKVIVPESDRPNEAKKTEQSPAEPSALLNSAEIPSEPESVKPSEVILQTDEKISGPNSPDSLEINISQTTMVLTRSNNFNYHSSTCSSQVQEPESRKPIEPKEEVKLVESKSSEVRLPSNRKSSKETAEEKTHTHRSFTTQRSQTQIKAPSHLPEPDSSEPEMAHTLDITSSYGTGPMDEKGRPLFGLGALRRETHVKLPSQQPEPESSQPEVTTVPEVKKQPDVEHTLDITSSYGAGPMDENGRPLFGLGALRRRPKQQTSQETSGNCSNSEKNIWAI